ncbi:MAG: polysaccharide biosynthesis/export family protein [Bacteroidaceae bacterium]|nr:polysaccharide biosynthesis/export family protein [Bacteroidaceae bacterium]
MKKLSFLGLFAVILLSLNSCVSSKKIIYFQGADTLYAQAQEIMQRYEMRIKPADQILVKLTCKEPMLLEQFNQDITIGSGGGSRSTSSSYIGNAGSMGSTYGYNIDNNGNVNLPIIGIVHVGGMTTDEAGKAIEQAIINKDLISEPEVTVRLLNARVTVMGAVKSPRVVSLTSERNTVLDVLAQCSDLSDASLRKNLKLFREENGKRMMYTIDLTSAEVFNSPAFYVQQNDMIYIEPNKAQNVRSSPFNTFLSTGASILSVVSSIVALVIALSK